MKNLSQKYDVMGVNIDVLDRSKFTEIIERNIEKDQKTVIYTPYSEFIYRAQIDKSFKDILNSANINIADGVFIQIASLYYETMVKTRFTIINFIKLLFLILKMIARKVDRTIIFPELLSGSSEIKTISKLSQEKDYSVYLLGGMQNVVYVASQNLKSEFPNLNVVRKQVGRAFSADDKQIFKDIDEFNPDILLVCFGGQKQERWVYKYRDQLHAKIIICLGGTFDYVSGKKKLQSKWWSDRGLNWLHRLISEPMRWRRQIVIFKLLWLLAKEK